MEYKCESEGFPKQSRAWYKQPKKYQKCLQPWGWTAAPIKWNVPLLLLIPYSPSSALNVKLPQLSFSLSCLQSWQTLWKNNNTSKYWGRAAVCGSRQYSSSVPAGVFIPISTLIEFSPQAHVLIYCSQCIDIFCNLGFLDYNRMMSCSSFPGFTWLCLRILCTLSINLGNVLTKHVLICQISQRFYIRFRFMFNFIWVSKLILNKTSPIN